MPIPVARADYVRAHRVVRAMVEVEGRDPAEACLLYSLAGSEILRRHFGLPAQAVVGAFALRVDVAGLSLMKFGEEASEGLGSHSGAFHSWIECGGYLVDLLAPLYGNAKDQAGGSHEIPSRMFQRPLEEAKVSLGALLRRGDFWISPNRRLTRELTGAYLVGRLPSDLISICSRWFQPKGRRIQKRVDIHGANDVVRQACLSSGLIRGHW